MDRIDGVGVSAGHGGSGTTVDPVELMALAERAALAAGVLVHDERPDEVEVAATKSTPTDVVTAMDTAAEELLLRILLGQRPDDAVLAEESGATTGTSGLTWVVDPIDGTVNYLYGLPAYAVSVAVVEGEPDPATWRLVAGCVHQPATGETWTAARGHGAFLNGRPIRPGRVTRLEEALVATGFGYAPQRRRRQARVLSELVPLARDVRRFGAASLDLCAVACGRVDAYYERGLKPWDLAAGSLIALEAGATVTGPRDRPAGEEFALISSPGLTDEMWRFFDALPEDLDVGDDPT